ncbi:hypothetical protein HGRIS_007869 [Hohenbuehelia grisea]|uniref:Large ribosomal subunit protein bL32m n=1 Tax=Hohenbuehelia grisea TaxID=104357 RepID=A0ABR3J6L2_9AGAR
MAAAILWNQSRFSLLSLPSSLAFLQPWAADRLGSPLQSLLELFPPFLLAVPKKKVSHSRKAMRAANKGLNDKQNIVNCPGCGSPKLAHHLCPNCYSFLNRLWKSKQKDGGSSIPDFS